MSRDATPAGGKSLTVIAPQVVLLSHQAKAFSRFSSSSGDIAYLHNTGKHSARSGTEVDENGALTRGVDAQGSEHLLNAFLFFRRRISIRCRCAATGGRGTSRSSGEAWQLATGTNTTALWLWLWLWGSEVTVIAASRAYTKVTDTVRWCNAMHQGRGAIQRGDIMLA